MLRSEALDFFSCFLKSPRSIGSIAPSSRFLSRKMARIDSQRPVTVVELGAGSGSITRQLSVKAEQVICYEKSPSLSAQLANKHPDIVVKNEDALNCIAVIDDLHAESRACNVVSSLPLTIMQRQYGEQLIQDIANSLDKGEYFSCYFYLPTIFLGSNRWILEALRDQFEDVSMSLEILNLPPALAITCTR